MTIVEFIEARIAEDEDIAAGARRGPRRPDGWSEDYGQEFIVVVGVRDGVPDCVVRSTDESRHIARHDPARVLRQCAAVRKILAAHREARVFGPPFEDADIEGGAADIWTGRDTVFELTLRAIAGFWADHPDYQEKWNA